MSRMRRDCRRLLLRNRGSDILESEWHMGWMELIRIMLASFWMKRSSWFPSSVSYGATDEPVCSVKSGIQRMRFWKIQIPNSCVGISSCQSSNYGYGNAGKKYLLTRLGNLPRSILASSSTPSTFSAFPQTSPNKDHFTETVFPQFQLVASATVSTKSQSISTSAYFPTADKQLQATTRQVMLALPPFTELSVLCLILGQHALSPYSAVRAHRCHILITKLAKWIYLSSDFSTEAFLDSNQLQDAIIFRGQKPHSYFGIRQL